MTGQTHYEEEEAFEKFCNETKSVSLCNNFVPRQEFRVHICTHKGTWLTGSGTQLREHSSLAVVANGKIEPGTSGGPIVNDDGELVGTVSSSAGSTVGSPCPRYALPVWVYHRAAG
jgi:hypothetical protein